MMDTPVQTVQMFVVTNGLFNLAAGGKVESIFEGEIES